jgi:hypothetical protein
MTSADEQERLGKAIDAVLREQPLRGAPASLEARVFAEVARRATQSWWQKDYTSWPIAARVTFVLASVGFAKGALMIAMWLLAGLKAVPTVVDLAPEATVLRAFTSFASSIFHGIPSLWLYGVLALVVGAYALLFGLGAAGYRTLYARQ